MNDAPHRPNWLLPVASMRACRVGNGGVFRVDVARRSLADFLAVAAVAVAGLLAWIYFDRGLTRNQRLAFGGMAGRRPDRRPCRSPMSDRWRQFGTCFVGNRNRRRSRGPPPKEFNHEYPTSEIVPDLTKSGKHDWPAYLRDGTGRAAAPSSTRRRLEEEPAEAACGNIRSAAGRRRRSSSGISSSISSSAARTKSSRVTNFGPASSAGNIARSSTRTAPNAGRDPKRRR